MEVLKVLVPSVAPLDASGSLIQLLIESGALLFELCTSLLDKLGIQLKHALKIFTLFADHIEELFPLLEFLLEVPNVKGIVKAVFILKYLGKEGLLSLIEVGLPLLSAFLRISFQLLLLHRWGYLGRGQQPAWLSGHILPLLGCSIDLLEKGRDMGLFRFGPLHGARL